MVDVSDVRIQEGVGSVVGYTTKLPEKVFIYINVNEKTNTYVLNVVISSYASYSE